MNHPSLPHAPSWQRVVDQTKHAIACGALKPFDTVESVIEDHGVQFRVRQAANLARKEEASKRAAKSMADASAAWRDPFSPCEEALRVGDIGKRHFLLLNKFNVLKHHLLVVTTEFEPQESLIDDGDFAALFACLRQFGGLGFYNGGVIAGSSQPHKHLQLVPLDAPIDTLVQKARNGAVFQVPQLTFAHAAAALNAEILNDAQLACDIYRRLLDAIGIADHQSPYNLLVTQRWMLAVPRTQSHVEGVALNALGFAGSLFVRDDAQHRVVQTLGPMALLTRASRSA